LIDPAPEPVTAAGGALVPGVDVGVGEAEGVGLGVGDGEAEGVGVGGYSSTVVGERDCAHAGDGSSESEATAANTADRVRLRTCLAMVSARTACRWDRCRHRR
jgi:hypothetical protein